MAVNQYNDVDGEAGRIDVGGVPRAGRPGIGSPDGNCRVGAR